MGEKIPKWEAKPWSYLGSGDGRHCPLISQCKIKEKCGWCPDANRKHLSRLLNGGRFDINNPDFTKIKSEGKELGELFQQVEMLAQRYIKMGGIHSPPVPTVLVGLIDPQRAVEIRTVPLTVYHGAVWHVNGSWIIQLKGSDISAAKRFTLFHEAFHILAHSKTTPVFRKKRGTLEGSFNEMLADYFAASILMPREWVKEKWAEVHDVNRMAKIFDAPELAMGVRLRQLGLI